MPQTYNSAADTLEHKARVHTFLYQVASEDTAYRNKAIQVHQVVIHQ